MSERRDNILEIPPRLMIAAPSGRSGKTIVSVALCNSLRKKGLRVQPFKKGPDYIDASWLTAASGKACRNLDAFMMKQEDLTGSFEMASQRADIALIEGNMGLYDGIDEQGAGSSADLARLLKTPILLVINTARMTRSVAALILGYQGFEPGTPIQGVILNNIAGQRHEAKLVRTIEQHCKIPVVGTIPRNANLRITERHLGLIPFNEVKTGSLDVDRILSVIEGNLHLDKILDIARSAPPYIAKTKPVSAKQKVKARIGVLSDKAFTFYYPENLEALTRCGAEIAPVNSFLDKRLPEIDGLYIGGGFPELYVEELSQNKSLLIDIASNVEAGLPVYAECAGLMYLSKGIRANGRVYKMAGIIPSEVELSKKPQGHGYVEAKVMGENPYFTIGMTLRGHEFHHSRLRNSRGLTYAFYLNRGQGADGLQDGIVYKNLFASYMHLHTLSNPGWAERFVDVAAKRERFTSTPSIVSIQGGK
jgi:cobyrinic acid a,c-diamide synthase